MSQTNRSVSEHLIRRVAEATDRDALDLPVLYDAVDPDALNAVVGSMSDGEVIFRYAGCEVTVKSDGTIALGDGTIEHPVAGPP